MDAALEPEDLEREFPGWVVWVTAGRLWYARRLKQPQVTLRSDGPGGLRQEIRAHVEGEL
ncbi:MAG TPA: hypothetical protein VGS19_29100 [Streptosporangiaceae bacterium]|nr:hypothetical protein [Streptosporangiaceae bacterium]